MQQLKNMMEDIVLSKYEEMKDHLDCCHCDACRLDVLSYALNHLPPKYVATHTGELYSKNAAYESQYRTDIISALTQAASIVRQYPRHQQKG